MEFSKNIRLCTWKVLWIDWNMLFADKDIKLNILSRIMNFYWSFSVWNNFFQFFSEDFSNEKVAGIVLYCIHYEEIVKYMKKRIKLILIEIIRDTPTDIRSLKEYDKRKKYMNTFGLDDWTFSILGIKIYLAKSNFL